MLLSLKLRFILTQKQHEPMDVWEALSSRAKEARRYSFSPTNKVSPQALELTCTRIPGRNYAQFLMKEDDVDPHFPRRRCDNRTMTNLPLIPLDPRSLVVGYLSKHSSRSVLAVGSCKAIPPCPWSP